MQNAQDPVRILKVTGGRIYANEMIERINRFAQTEAKSILNGGDMVPPTRVNNFSHTKAYPVRAGMGIAT